MSHSCNRFVTGARNRVRFKADPLPLCCVILFFFFLPLTTYLIRMRVSIIFRIIIIIIVIIVIVTVSPVIIYECSRATARRARPTPIARAGYLGTSARKTAWAKASKVEKGVKRRDRFF